MRSGDGSNGIDYRKKRAELRTRNLRETRDDEPDLDTGGVDHLALICSDIEATTRFYIDV